MKRASDDRLLYGAVFAAVLLLDLSHRSLYFNFDGIACAIAVELSDFKHLVHGNHLAYGVVAWAFDRAWRLFGYEGRAIIPLQVLDAVLGAAGATAFASLLRRSGRAPREAALGAAALALCHAWWFWSLESQVYMLGCLFAALAAREALGEKPRAARVGVWHAIAVLGHVGHLTALPALGYLLWRREGRKGLKPYLLGLISVVAGADAAAGLFAVRPASFVELKLWLLGSAALGVDRAFSWHAAPVGASLTAWAGMTFRIFVEFVGRSGAWRVAGGLLAGLPLIAAAFGVRRGGPVARFWLIWLAGYAALFLSWEPFTIVYRVSDLLALWALAWLGLERLKPGARVALVAAWAAAAGAFNLAFVVRPAAEPASNADLVETKWVEANTPPNSWVLANGRGAVYLPYFADRRPLNLRYLADEKRLEERLDALAGAGETVFVTDKTMDDLGLLPTLARYGLEPEATGDGFALYRVRRAASPKAKAGKN